MMFIIYVIKILFLLYYYFPYFYLSYSFWRLLLSQLLNFTCRTIQELLHIRCNRTFILMYFTWINLTTYMTWLYQCLPKQINICIRDHLSSRWSFLLLFEYNLTFSSAQIFASMHLHVTFLLSSILDTKLIYLFW